MAFHRTWQSLRQHEIQRVAVASNLSSWEVQGDLDLPAHMDRIIDLVPATIFRSKGVFLLYETSGKLGLLYTAYTRSFEFTIDCPRGERRQMAAAR